MLPLGMLLVLGGYGIGSWGWLLVKGENITLREWFSPLHPFTGSLDANGKVPPGHIFPTGKKGTATGSAGAPSGQQSQAAQQQQRAGFGAAQLGQDIGNFLGGIVP